MSSINFNSAANSALRTLQASNTALDATQKRISTGLTIGEAKDNAAYWSISTTLKSDNKALGTVSDALGLGAATVDTAYQGLNAAKDVLDQIKQKLVAASQDGVDKSAVQGEIAQLQNQLKAIASSSTFSGENWLSVDSTSGSYNATKSVVSSFNRAASGAVTVDTIQIDSSSFVLFDANSAKEGILDAGKVGNTAVNGLATSTIAAVTAAGATVTPAGTLNAANITASTFSGSVVYNGQTFTFSGTATATSAASLATIIGSAQVGGTGPALSTLVTVDPATLAITSNATGSSQSLAVTITAAAGSGLNIATTNGTAGIDAGQKSTAAAFGSTALTLDKNDSIAMVATVDGVAKKFSITRSAVDAALGAVAGGRIGTAGAYASVINKALQQANITGIVASATNTGTPANDAVVLTASGATALTVNPAVASKGTSVLGIDVTTADRSTIVNYINIVSDATKQITASAATLGAVTARLDLQKTFVQNLMDTIDKGVSGLIDADMNEESTKLQALQVKQQLGVQALSIANQSAQSVLSLFRS
ncbi:flagellin [Aureimonas phyllosphaerae]|uniref:flagellin N-terminal helical domain-containing protein n=1 Tax=Aureimonas phyllosphaerae TaxID=1166078 RepID=UPI003A5C6B0A